MLFNRQNMHHMMDTHHKLPDIWHFHFRRILYQTLLSLWSYQTTSCKDILFMNLSDCLSTTTRETSVKYKKFLLGSFSVAKFGTAPTLHWYIELMKIYWNIEEILKYWRGIETLKRYWNIENILKYWGDIETLKID